MGACVSVSKEDDGYAGKKGSYVMENPYVIIPPSPLLSAGYQDDSGASTSYSDKISKRLVKLTKNRHGIDVEKATHTELITFDELLCKSLGINIMFT